MKKDSFVISPVDIAARKKADVRSGDTVKVWQKIQEKGKTRLQLFEGLVLAVKHGKEAGSTFTVRRIASGVGVEKIFPLYSPMIDKITVVKHATLRRAKLYHVREQAAKAVKRQMRNTRMVVPEEDPAEEAPVEEVVETQEEVVSEESK
jgi:large subunit ribosomal protein L19